MLRYKPLLALAVAICGGATAFAVEPASVNLPVTELKYAATGIGPLQAAPAYGDIAHGAHGTFIRQPPGFNSGAHVHSESYYAVVVTGVVVNGKPGSTDVPLPSGSYWFQKGGETHVSKCVSSNECVVFLVQAGKFDFVPAKK